MPVVVSACEMIQKEQRQAAQARKKRREASPLQDRKAIGKYRLEDCLNLATGWTYVMLRSIVYKMIT